MIEIEQEHQQEKSYYSSNQLSQKSIVDRRASRTKQINILQKDVYDNQKHENYTEVEKQKTAEDKEFIINCLKNHFVFFSLEETELQNLVEKMFYCEVEQNQFIMEQGQSAQAFFILSKGSIQVIINQEIKKDIQQGEGFGELALLYNAPRSASCKSIQKCEMWGLNRVQFKQAIELTNQSRIDENIQFINKIHFFENLTKSQKYAISSVFITQKFLQDQAIVNQDDPASSYYIIKSGSVTCVKDGQEIRTLVSNEAFGESGILQGDHLRALSIYAKEDTVCLAIGKDVLKRVLGNQVEQVIYKNIAKYTLEKMDGFSMLNLNQMYQLIENLTFKYYKEDFILEVQDKPVKDQIILCIVGEIQIESSGNTLITKFQGLGGPQMLNLTEEKYPKNLLIKKNSVVSIVTQKQIEHVFGDKPLQQIIELNNSIQQAKQLEIDQRKEMIKSFQLNDFEAIKLIGQGQFGAVYLVSHKQTNNLYCIKVIEKKRAVQCKLEQHIIQEKQILSQIDHPFMIQFQKSFQDYYHIYFLMELVQGVELFDAIREIGLLGTFDSQFYTSQIILQLEYLHNNSIIYRDLKPENIMVNEDGYLKLIDMGSAKNLSSGSRSITILGTPHYMAPEILTGRGYGFQVDLWSLGCCLYEFMCGQVPFGDDFEDPMQIYKEVVSSQSIPYPDFIVDNDAKQFINLLLNKTPELRIPGASFQNLKQHVWFQEFQWSKIEQKQYPSPYKPPKIQHEGGIETENKSILEAIRKEQGGLNNPIQSYSHMEWEKEF